MVSDARSCVKIWGGSLILIPWYCELIFRNCGFDFPLQCPYLKSTLGYMEYYLDFRFYKHVGVLRFHYDIDVSSSKVQGMSGSHSTIKDTRRTVVWPWRTLVKMILPCSAKLISLLFACVILLELGLPWETGSFPMELQFPAVINSGISTEMEARVL